MASYRIEEIAGTGEVKGKQFRAAVSKVQILDWRIPGPPRNVKSWQRRRD
jgi:hypothetical protein